MSMTPSANKIDQIIQNLYLCSTDNRENMHQAIIENILYSLSESMTKEQILEFIKSEFHLEIDEFEISGTLERLVADGAIEYGNNSYQLSQSQKDEVSKNIILNNEIEKTRNENLKKVVSDFNPAINVEETERVINVFSEYVYECFLEYGRNAIRFFLPNNPIDSSNVLINNKLNFLGRKIEQSAFLYLCNNYAKHLSSNDLSYLENLALKAEKFFALGVPAEELDKANDFKINNLIVLIDTNFIYSILGLHIHPEDEACRQLVKIIKSKQIDCRLVFIPKTLSELKQKRVEFERTITAEKLSYNQIRSLIESDELTKVAKEYFTKKTIWSRLPPSK